MASSWRDVSVPIHPGMTVFPDTPGVEVERVARLEDGDPANVSRLELATHTGTHVDAPAHFLEGADAVDDLPPDRFCGPARVLDLRETDRVGAEALEPAGIEGGTWVLLRTPNSERRWHERPFDPGYAHLAADGARHLVERGARGVGIDYLSIGSEEHDNPETHRTLLDGGVAILEGLDLSEVTPGDYDLLCLPLRVAGGDGAPARALLRPRTDG